MRRWLSVILTVMLLTACTSSDSVPAESSTTSGPVTTNRGAVSPQGPDREGDGLPPELAQAILDNNVISEAAADLVAKEASRVVAAADLFPNVGQTIIDWEMPSRWAAGYSAYQPIGQTTQDRYGPAPDIVWGWDPNYVDPPAWDATLISCDTPTDSEPVSWSWQFSGPDGFEDSFESERCRVGVTVPSLGRYDVRLDIGTEDGSTVSGSRTITLSDRLIVYMGDSSASGEGNPLDWESFDGFTWDDPRCHRSRHAGGAQAAEALDEQDPRSSVTFVHLGCSGAKLTTGVLFPYHGQEVPPETDTPLEAQLHQLQRALCRGEDPWACTRTELRPIDSLIVQVGVNDLGFGAIMTRCAWHPSSECYNTGGLAEDVRQGFKSLRTPYFAYNLDQYSPCKTLDCEKESPLWGYGTILERFEAGGVQVKDTYLVGYPNGVFGGEDGETTGGCGAFELINQDEADWLKETALALNEVIRLEALLMGAYPILDFAADFERHGYCAGDEQRVLGGNGHVWYDRSESWFVTVTRSDEFQGNVDGSVHPDGDGHARIAQSILTAMAATKTDYTPTRRLRVYVDEIRLTEPGIEADLFGDQQIALQLGGNASILDAVTDENHTLYRTGRTQQAPMPLTPGEWSTAVRGISYDVEWSPEFEHVRLYVGTWRPSLLAISGGLLRSAQLPEEVRRRPFDLADVTLDSPEVVPPQRPPDPEEDNRVFSWELILEPRGDGSFGSRYLELSISSQFPIEEGGELAVHMCVFDDPLPVASFSLPDQMRCKNLLNAGPLEQAP